MAGPDDERLWTARLRWRLRGAWQGPTFVLATLAEAALLHWLPFAGDTGLDLVGAVLLAGFANLAVVAILGPLLAVVLRRRGGTLPREIVRDRTATGLMTLLVALVLVGGLVHRSEIVEAREDHRRQLLAAQAYVAHQAGPEYRPGIPLANTWKLDEDRYRTCFPAPQAQRALCVYVTTDGPRPVVRRDPDQRPNSVVAGPDNPGRSGG